jgi:hypothetical protein
MLSSAAAQRARQLVQQTTKIVRNTTTVRTPLNRSGSHQYLSRRIGSCPEELM